MEAYATAIGLMGVAIVVLAYGLYAAHKLRSDDWRYPLLNIVGTAGILVSLCYDWNLPSFVAQVVWIVLSIVGLLRIIKQRASLRAKRGNPSAFPAEKWIAASASPPRNDEEGR